MTSINTAPDLYQFAPGFKSCITCYPVNETPDDLFLSLSGILRGDNWIATDPPPPNGIHKLTTLSPCFWFEIDGTWVFTFLPTGGTSDLAVSRIAGSIPVFTGVRSDQCKTRFKSSIITPTGTIYYSGEAVLTPMLPTNNDYVPDVMELLNIEANSDTWAHPTPVNDSETVIRIFDATDATNIHVRFDTP